MLFVEHTLQPFHNTGRQIAFTPTEELQDKVGFRTIAQWTAQDVSLAKEAGTIMALADKPSTIDTLYVDFDNKEKDAMRFREWLKSEMLTYEMWDSGGRSQHFHIPIVPLYSVHAPSSLRTFMTKHCRQLEYDSSIYAYSSLFRLPNTEHIKTGRRKTLLETHKTVDILQVDITEPQRFDTLTIHDVDEFTVVMNRYVNLLQNTPGEGNRSTVLWSMSSAFCEVGVDIDTAEQLIRRLNLSWKKDAKEESKVLSQLRYAYQKS